MNFCELELVKAVQDSGDVEEIAKELYAADPTKSIDEIITYLHQLINTMKSQGSVLNSLGFQEFFRVGGKIDNITYVKVRGIIQQKLIDAIFGNIPALSNARLDDNINALKRAATRNLGESSLKLHYQYTNQKEQFVKEQNAEAIANYLIAYHLPLIVQTIARNVIKYENNKFEFSIQTKVRTDWNSDSWDDRPAELNSAVKMMLEATPMLDIAGNKVGTFCLTTNSFFFAISELFEHLEREFVSSIRNPGSLEASWYQKILDNPLELINYFLSSDFNDYIETDGSLSGNILRSVVTRWIKNGNQISEFAQFCLNSSDASHYNPLHLLITSAAKNASNTFLDREYTPTIKTVKKQVGKKTVKSDETTRISSKITILDKRRSLLSEVGARAIESISKEELKGLLPNNPEDLTTTHVKQVLSKLFPYQPISIPNNDSRLPNWKTHFKLFYNFIESKTDSFADIVSAEKAEGAKDSPAESYYWIVRNALNTNPYLAKGTQTNNLESQVPVYGLRTVANSIPQCLANLKTAVNRKNEVYGKLGIVHTSPYEHSALFKGEMPIPKTVYNSSFKFNSREDAPIKEYRDLTAKEMAQLSIYYDYMDAGSVIRIQPITVSDKTRVPFFEFNKAEVLRGRTNESMLSEIETLYKQSIVNTLNDLSRVLYGESTIDTDVKTLAWETIETALIDLNTKLTNDQVSKKSLWTQAEQYNNANGTNITFAEHLDFTENKDGSISIGTSALLYVTAMKDGSFWENLFTRFLNNLQTICPDILGKDLPAEVKTLLESIERGDGSYKNSELYNYFVLHNYLTENVLSVTVGLPMSHKGSGKDWEHYDSKSNLTMVKRMVALTATMHPCTKGVLTGLPNEIKTQTVDLGSVEMYTYSGNTPSGSGFTGKLDVSDGIIWGTRAGDNLLKASIGDVRPKGNMLKLLHHDFDPVKGYSRLVKCAEMCVDNAMIRTWDIHPEDEKELDVFSPKNFMKLSFQKTEINLDSFLEFEDTGEVLLSDYNDSELVPTVYRKFGDVVYTLNKIMLTKDNKIELEYIGDNDIETVICDLNLYSLWEGFGGAFSCDRNGNYNEGSQDALTTLLNRIGFPTTDGPVNSQSDVDQYLKKQVVYYIHSATAQKSLQPPTSTLQEALNGEGFTIKMGIDRLGIQLDADHSSEDSHIREISQLMSNLAEGGFVGDKAEKVYSRLQTLVQTSLDALHISSSKLSSLPEHEQKYIHDFLGKKFSQIFKRKMADPDADVMGLANAIAVELRDKNVLIPISDRQHLSKYHTTVGSYFNKFIARAWSGRGDVLMPGHNMLMVYEDSDGNVYMPGDYKLDGDTKIPIRDFIRSNMFNDDGTVKRSFVDRYKVTKHDIHPNTNYYIVNELGEKELFVTDTYDKLMSLSNLIEALPVDSGGVIVAYNLPRNLKAKQVGVNITIEREGVITKEYHDIYFFNTHRNLAQCGILLSKLDKVTDKTIDDVLKTEIALFTGIPFAGVNVSKSKLIAMKRDFSSKFQNILTRIAAGNFSDLEKELDLPFNDGLETRTASVYTKLDERITSNNYTHVWGNGSFSEIAQLEDKYFRNRLLKILSSPAEHSSILTKEGSKSGIELFTMLSKCVFCVSNFDHIQDGAIETAVVVDEENYRIDSNGRRMYMWPEGARLFTKNGYDIILLDSEIFDDKLEVLLKSSYFSGYRSEKERGISISYYGSFQNNSRDFDNHVSSLSMAQYQSWLKTNHCIQARIPSQSLSFAMHLETVGYCPWMTNISICSDQHVFTQGSDFDIDKIYAMMYSVNGSGIIKQSEEYNFQVVDNLKDNITQEDRLIIDLLGQHIGKLLKMRLNSDIVNVAFVTDPESIDSLYNQLSSLLLGVGKLSGSTVTVSAWHVLEQALSVANIDPEHIRESGTQGLIWLNTLIESLNKKTQVLKDQNLDQYGGLQNNTLDQMIDIFDDVRILMPSTTPTTMYPINSVVERLGLEGKLRNHLDPSSVWFVNQTAMVGKDGVGITASAQKAMLALTQYNSMRLNENFVHPTSIKLPLDWQTYYHDGKIVNTEFFVNFVLPGQKLNSLTLDAIYKWASEWTVDKVDTSGKIFPYHPLTVEKISIDSETESIRIKGAQFGNDFVVLSKGRPIDVELATTINSAFISSATDNAKEMKLDLIGGHPLLLPAFMYGLTLGMPVELLVRIFTDDKVQSWILQVRGNIFRGDSTNVRLSNKLSDLKDKEKRDVVKLLVKGGETLTALSRILSINQGIKVNVGEIQNWYLKLEKSIDSVIPDNITTPSDGYSRFNAYEFFELPDMSSRRQYAKLREDYEMAFNVLDVLATVPHYYAMCKVPLTFKSIMENQSTDIRLLHNTMADDYFTNRFIDSKNISKYLKSINQLKIFEFLRHIDWEYNTDSVYVGSFLNDESEDISTLRTSESRGVYSLKKFIENNVIHAMQERIANNAFLANIQRVTRLMPEVSKGFVKALGISFNMALPQNKDMADIVRLGFYEIQDEIVEGHTFGEWMFIYDLLVNHHDVGSNSFTNVFDQMIDFGDENNIITQYYNFVLRHDDPTNRPYSVETKNLIPVKVRENDGDDEFRGSKTYCLGEVLPLRVDVEYRMKSDSYIFKSALHRYYNNGNLFIFNC